jgi:hypothetical protein
VAGISHGRQTTTFRWTNQGSSSLTKRIISYTLASFHTPATNSRIVFPNSASPYASLTNQHQYRDGIKPGDLLCSRNALSPKEWGGNG